jgi:hypothetical protein
LASTTTYQNNKAIRKLDHQRLSPFLFVKQINVAAFQFKLQGSMIIHHVFHVLLLEPYHMSTIPKRIHDPLPLIKVDGEHEYEVEGILYSRIYDRQFQYLVH